MITYAENISGSIQDNWLFLEAWLWGNRQEGRFFTFHFTPSICSKNILFTISIHYLYNKTTIQGSDAIKETYAELWQQ